jgi:3-hydroxyacyl-[acyl-carrier-protein] dehydratase
MLLNNFYHIVNTAADQDVVRATIDFNVGHLIFEGHFPGNPVVPGVCMIQLCKEVFEKQKHVQTRLLSADTIKFLSVINPNETKTVVAEIKYTLHEDTYTMNVTLSFGEITYFKFKGLLQVV